MVFRANDFQLYLLIQGVLADAEGDELGEGLNKVVGKAETDKSVGLPEADGLSPSMGRADPLSSIAGLFDALLLGAGVGMGIIV